MDLTPDEIAFLVSHKFSQRDVFDARGMIGAVWKARIRRECKEIALGNPCNQGGHRLKTRSGHCAQCKPANIGFQRRHSEQAEVYIAFSRSKKLTKVGSSKECYNRMIQINREMLGGASDWILLYKRTVSEGARLEVEVQSKLKSFLANVTYLKDGRAQSSRECFHCSPQFAFSEIEKLILELSIEAGNAYRSPQFPAV